MRRFHDGDTIRSFARVGIILSTAGLIACDFEPLYGRHQSSGDESIRDKLSDVLIAPIPSRQGTPQARIAVTLRKRLAVRSQRRSRRNGSHASAASDADAS